MTSVIFRPKKIGFQIRIRISMVCKSLDVRRCKHFKSTGRQAIIKPLLLQQSKSWHGATEVVVQCHVICSTSWNLKSDCFSSLNCLFFGVSLMGSHHHRMKMRSKHTCKDGFCLIVLWQELFPPEKASGTSNLEEQEGPLNFQWEKKSKSDCTCGPKTETSTLDYVGR